MKNTEKPKEWVALKAIEAHMAENRFNYKLTRNTVSEEYFFLYKGTSLNPCNYWNVSGSKLICSHKSFRLFQHSLISVPKATIDLCTPDSFSKLVSVMQYCRKSAGQYPCKKCPGVK